VVVAARLGEAEKDPHLDHAAVEQLRSAFAVYERDLNLLGLDDAQVTAGYPPGRLRLAVAWGAMKVVVALPLAAIGSAVHVIPFQIMKQLAKKPTNEGIKATVKLLGCLVSFLLVNSALGVFVGEAFGGLAGFLSPATAPLCGYATVRLHERVRRVGDLVDGYRTMRLPREGLASVMEHRSAVTAAARSVLGGL
jgi:hypothetical protein